MAVTASTLKLTSAPKFDKKTVRSCRIRWIILRIRIMKESVQYSSAGIKDVAYL